MAQIALVTGVGKETGIGFEVVRQLAETGATVWLTARNPKTAKSLAEKVAGDIRYSRLDITDRAQISALAAQVYASHGRLDVLVNNAAAMSPWGEKAATADLDAAHKLIDTTLFGTWAMCEAFLPLLRMSTAGRLINVSSGAGSHGDTAFGLTTGNAMGTSYAVSKAGLNALTVRLAMEEESAVRINAVCPGFTATFDGGSEMGARPVAEGAASILWAAFIPNDGPTGGFFRDGKQLAW